MLSDQIAAARILIVDDEPANLRYLERALRLGGFTAVHQAVDPRTVVDHYLTTPPDLLILDLMMPHLDGFGVLEQLRPLIAPDDYLPILMLTADNTTEIKQQALAAGATDFLTKPFDPLEVALRSRNLLRTRLQHLALQSQNALLEERVRERTRELAEARLEILERLALAAEYRDDITGRHVQRVSRTAARIAAALGLPTDQVDLIHQATPLHDVGKIGIPDELLGKPGRLTPEEFAEVQEHAAIGGRILAGGQSPLIQTAQVIALSHHERWDGTGYPHRLAGEQIPLEGRIVAVADVFDALLESRPYKDAWPLDAAVAEIQRQRGQQFDPAVVDAFQQLLDSGMLGDAVPATQA